MKMNFETNQASTEQANTAQTSTEKNQQVKDNPVLNFILNVTDAGKYIWQHYMEWIIDVSWAKLLLACLLTLIIGGILSLHSLANWLVLGSLLLKCFIGKEDQNRTASMSSPATTTTVDSKVSVPENTSVDESRREN
jgi:hypothetical protein